jgi:adenosylhomocysteine nucleosidase
MTIGIIVAMDKELQQLQALFVGSSVLVQKCGIGKVNAALGTQRLITQFCPDIIISSGCAGGNGDDVCVQDIVVGSEVAYHDVYCGKAVDSTTIYGQVQGLPARYKADPALLNKALSCMSLSDSRQPSAAVQQPRIHQGLIVTGDWFVDSKDKMRSIIAHFPEAKAVDMESCAIAQTCHIHGVPFISFRIISDIPLRDTDASQYHNFWDTIADHSFQVTKTFVESL